MAVIKRFFHPSQSNFFLFGPRGTGKTFWLEQTYPDALILSLLLPDVFKTYSAYPERLKELIEANPKKRTIIIDEIQKIPELLSVVHYMIEKNKKIRFILTGSSARKLKRTGVNLLGGRALNYSLHPFMASELKDNFSFEKAMHTGMIPLIWFSNNASESLHAYIDLYLREEVQVEARVRNIGGFSRFMDAISFSHASLLNASNISRECEVPRKTVEGFIEILEDLLIGYRLPVFNARQKRNLITHSKFYFFDVGIFRAIKPASASGNSGDTEGAALEGLILQHIRAWNAYKGNEYRIYFWRTHSGLEVDFIISGKNGLWAIEVKNSRTIHPHDLKGLHSFGSEFNKAHLIFIYRGKERLKKGKIICMPCEEFLINLHPDKMIPGILF